MLNSWLVPMLDEGTSLHRCSSFSVSDPRKADMPHGGLRARIVFVKNLSWINWSQAQCLQWQQSRKACWGQNSSNVRPLEVQLESGRPWKCSVLLCSKAWQPANQSENFNLPPHLNLTETWSSEQMQSSLKAAAKMVEQQRCTSLETLLWSCELQKDAKSFLFFFKVSTVEDCWTNRKAKFIIFFLLNLAWKSCYVLWGAVSNCCLHWKCSEMLFMEKQQQRRSKVYFLLAHLLLAASWDPCVKLRIAKSACMADFVQSFPSSGAFVNKGESKLSRISLAQPSLEVLLCPVRGVSNCCLHWKCSEMLCMEKQLQRRSKVYFLLAHLLLAASWDPCVKLRIAKSACMADFVQSFPSSGTFVNKEESKLSRIFLAQPSMKVLRCPVRGRGPFPLPLKVFGISLHGGAAAKKVKGVQPSGTLALTESWDPSVKLRVAKRCEKCLVDILQSFYFCGRSLNK